MNFFDRILTLLILIYIVVLPIFPSKYKIDGVPLNGDVILAIIIFFYLINLIFNRGVRDRLFIRIKNLVQDFTGLSGILLLLVMVFSVTYSQNRSIAAGETIRFGTYIALYFIIKLEVKGENIKNTLIAIMTMAVLISVIGLLGLYFGFGVEKQSSSNGIMMLRIESTLENSNNLGAFLILTVFPMISFTLNEKKIINKILAGLGSIIIFAAMVSTQSRNCLLAFAFGCICYVLIYNWKSVVFLIIAFVGMLFVPQIRNRVMQIGDVAQDQSRIKLWKIALKMIKDHKILGVGNGNYVTAYSKYEVEFKDVYYNTYGQFHPHNILLKVQSELGIMGTIAFISLMLAILKNLYNVIKYKTGKFYEHFYKGFLVSFISFMMMNLLDNFFSAPKVIAFFWILIALAGAILNQCSLKVAT